jgi:Ser/Thr protein kinase RdoA (MazF antagonist)
LARKDAVEEISRILKNYPTDCQPTAVEALGSAGGLSGARFWRIVAPRGALVLRCWPIEHPTPAGLGFIHAVLRHVAGRGVDFLPIPLPTTNGDSFVRVAGRLWELAPWLAGSADYEHNPSVEKLRAAMQALAKFHLATDDFASGPRQGIPPAVSHRLKRLVELQNGGVESLVSAISSRTLPELAPLAVEFARALPRTVSAALSRLAPFEQSPFPLQPCIRDVWHDHVLFDGDRVTGLVDFGALQVDTPATDVARLLGSLAGDDAQAWRQGLEAYCSIHSLTDQELEAVPALDAAGTILAGCNWIRWIYIDQRRFDNQAQITERFAKLLGRVQHVSRWA